MQYIEKYHNSEYLDGWSFDPRSWSFGVEWSASQIWFSFGPLIYQNTHT